MEDKETLEKAAKKIITNMGWDWENTETSARRVAEYCAKHQQERMYSEDEVQVKLYECLGHFAYKHNIIINGNEIDQWFEQFKKNV